jgi:hypothetical protein
VKNIKWNSSLKWWIHIQQQGVLKKRSISSWRTLKLKYLELKNLEVEVSRVEEPQSWSISSWRTSKLKYLKLRNLKVEVFQVEVWRATLSLEPILENSFFDYSLGGYSHRERWARTRRYLLVKH